ncbi:hypothetical protein D3C85_1462900 [compost metagenome]
MHRDDIQKLGARAAREGLTLWDCPYYVAAAMPGHTGESIAEWREKVSAWERGWRAQMRRRAPQTQPAADMLGVAVKRSFPVILRSG